MKGAVVNRLLKFYGFFLIAGVLIGGIAVHSLAANYNTDPPPTISSVDTLIYENFNGPEGKKQGGRPGTSWSRVMALKPTGKNLLVLVRSKKSMGLEEKPSENL